MAALCESEEPLSNPGRGWYHIYTFRPDERNYDALQWLFLEDTETLVLLRLDIGAFRQTPLDDAALSFVEEVLGRFCGLKKDIILRVLYDTEGKGMEREPSTLSMVQTHMRQLGAIVSDYADAILVSQGLFIGNWGEMHGSKFLGAPQLRTLEATWRKATQGKVGIALRKPVFCRIVRAAGEPVQGIGLYDDALFASATHLGTFGVKKKAEADWEEPWCAVDELAYLTPYVAEVPCGGEALAGEQPDWNETILKLRQMQISYLNSVHGEKRLAQWKEINGAAGTLYDYIGAHLGYRFTVRKAEVKWRANRITLQIENTGFAPLYDAAELFFQLESNDGESRRIPIPYDMRSISGGTMAEIVTGTEQMKAAVSADGAQLFLGMMRQKDGRSIRFANEKAKELLFLGTITDCDN